MATRTTAKPGAGVYGGTSQLPPPSRPVSKGVVPRSKAKARKKANTRAAEVPAIADRVLVLCLLCCAVYLVLVGRLFYLQVMSHDRLVGEAKKIRAKTILLPARRGELFDRNGTQLVRNEPAYAIVLDPNPWFENKNVKAKNTPDEQKQVAIQGLQNLLEDVDVAGTVAKRGIKQGKSGRYRTIDIAPVVSEGVGERIRKANLPGVGVLPTARRVALDGELATHVLGFTRRDGAGAAGIEYALDAALTGEAGVVEGEFDTRNRPIPGTVRQDKPALNGKDIVLTLDSDLQHIVQEALFRAYKKSNAASATAIVLDPSNGDILALANYPSYDVNLRKQIPAEARSNKAVTAPFEPGSTMKAFTIAAALEERKILPDSHFFCNGFRQIGTKKIRCHDGEKHGYESLTSVMTNSCNVATAQCAFEVGKTTFYKHLIRYGFGDKTSAGLPGESRGILSKPERWSEMQLANIAFGQGVSVTALQMAAAYGAIANEGILIRPRIVYGTRAASGEVEEFTVEDGKRVISAENARILRKMLETVVEEGTGTSARLAAHTAAGKTGTAQVAEKGRYRGKHMASFVGFTPTEDARFVILVAVTDPKGEYYGGQVAAPVFKEIAEKALINARVPRTNLTAKRAEIAKRLAKRKRARD
jgi:cell division protein FtsI/penicillin-binding protein 2